MAILSEELIKKRYPQIPADTDFSELIERVDNFVEDRARIAIPSTPEETPTWLLTPSLYLAFKFYTDTLQVIDDAMAKEARWKYEEACEILDRHKRHKPVITFGKAERSREW